MAPRRDGRRILPFRIPFFRIFYSTTYTTLYFITIGILAITPGSLIYTTIQNRTYQYLLMIGVTYIFVALCALFIYSSRLYTNRTVLAGVGKSYVPVEEGEVGRSVRKMIVKQLERSAIVAWEGRPRDLYGEILRAEQQGVLPDEREGGLGRDDYTLGREIAVDPAYPPWGHIKHLGWSSPDQTEENEMPNLQFAVVVRELPNLIEARAVSLAPADPLSTPREGTVTAEPAVADVLKRPETMGMRDYLTQLALLGLLNPPESGQRFLALYEQARFSGVPVSEADFISLMNAFANLLAGMNELRPEIVEEIRRQTDDSALAPAADDKMSLASSISQREDSSIVSPVTARTNLMSGDTTPYLHPETPSMDSFSSVIHRTPDELHGASTPTPAPGIEGRALSIASSSSTELESESGSVIRRVASLDSG